VGVLRRADCSREAVGAVERPDGSQYQEHEAHPATNAEGNQADGEGDQDNAVNDGNDSDCPRVPALPWTKKLYRLCRS
jgi:hypothetical protein